MSTTQQDIDHDEKQAKLKVKIHEFKLSVEIAVAEYMEAGASETWLAEAIVNALPREQAKVLMGELKYFLEQ
jgi:hypothetical protein